MTEWLTDRNGLADLLAGSFIHLLIHPSIHSCIHLSIHSFVRNSDWLNGFLADTGFIEWLPSDRWLITIFWPIDNFRNDQCDKAVEMLTNPALFEQSEALQDRIACELITLLLLNLQTNKQAVILSQTMAQSTAFQKHFLLKDMKTFIKTKGLWGYLFEYVKFSIRL